MAVAPAFAVQGGEKPFTYGDCVSELATDNLEGETPREFIATMEVANVYLGDRLGLYRALADVGRGAGRSSISIARAYPNAWVDGFDLDEPFVELARDNAERAGLVDRLSFHVRDASDAALEGRYDLATAFECIHDMRRPVEALRAMRRLVGEEGAVIVADERVADSLQAPGDDTERLMHG